MASLAASSGGSKGTRVTSKSWFITYHEEMLIWKQGERLKLQHDVSAGRVISASILNEKEKTIKVCIGSTPVALKYYIIPHHTHYFVDNFGLNYLHSH